MERYLKRIGGVDILGDENPAARYQSMEYKDYQ